MQPIHMNFYDLGDGRLMYSYKGYAVPRAGETVQFLGMPPMKVVAVLWCLGGMTAVRITVTA